jgi:parvulin-like peptidyl-prolyl isomerase
MRARAEAILAKVSAGSDFAALANELSEDPGNKDETGKGRGGLYDWRDRAGYVKEFSDAAWALNAGQTSRIVETQFGYHIIKLEGKRIQKDERGKDEEQIKVRHILISTMYKQEPGPGAAGNAVVEAPMITMEEGARKELTDQKKASVLAGIVARNPIALPEDFQINAPAETGTGHAAVKPGAKKAPATAKKAAARKSVKKGKARYSKKKP